MLKWQEELKGVGNVTRAQEPAVSSGLEHRCLKLSVSRYFLQLLMLQKLPLLLEGNRFLEHAVIAISGIKVAGTKKEPSIATSCAHLQDDVYHLPAF